MIIVHHLNGSRSQRVLWLLEELELPYEIKKYDRNPKTLLAPPELKRVHPLGKSPVLTDGDYTVAESGAIIEYLVNKYGNGRLKPPAGSKEELKYIYWLHYAEGSAMFPLLLSLIFSRLPKQKVPFFIKPVLKIISKKFLSSYVYPQLKLHTEFMESELKKTSWFAGNDFTAADIQMSFPIVAAAARSNLISKDSKLSGFISRIHSRPAFIRAVEKGGPFDMPV